MARSGSASVAMAYFTVRDASPEEYCRDVVSRSDVYVGIIGFEYGAPVRGHPQLSYTELEFEYATELGLPRLIFLIREETIRRDHDRLDSIRQLAFRSRLTQSGITVATISTPADLEIRLYQALVELRPSISMARTSRRGLWSRIRAVFSGL